MSNATVDQADRAIAAYDAAVFAPRVNLAQADLLAASAAIDCDEVANDASEPRWMRERYAETAKFLRTQIA